MILPLSIFTMGAMTVTDVVAQQQDKKIEAEAVTKLISA